MSQQRKIDLQIDGKSIHYKDVKEEKQFPSLLDFAATVEEMRDAQKEYFRLSAKARRTRNPEQLAESKEVLELSKSLEKHIDVMVNQIKEGGKQ